MKKLLFLMALAFAALVSCSGSDSSDNGDTPTPPPSPVPQQQDAITYAQTLGIGWNLGNSLDAHANGVSNETCWGNGKATQATFDAVKRMGFSSVRIPVTWMGHIGAAPEYKIDDAWMNRVAEVAGYAKKAGLKAIINVHHDGAASNDNGTASFPKGVWLRIDQAMSSTEADAQIKAEITKVWSQIAKRFAAEGEWLMFETFNEIHDGMWGYPINDALYRKMNEWNQTALDAIRATGGNNETRYVGIPCYAANPSFAKAQFVLPKDKAKNRLMVAVHTYDPYDYAGAANTSEWGHTASNNSAAYKESYLTTILNNLKSRFISNGIPVYFGEFGCVHRSTERAEAFRKYYLEYNIKNMRDNKIPVMIWDNGSAGSGAEKFGLINHANGSYIKNSDIDDAKEIIDLMVKAWNNDSKDYTLESVWNGAPK